MPQIQVSTHDKIGVLILLKPFSIGARDTQTHCGGGAAPDTECVRVVALCLLLYV